MRPRTKITASVAGALLLGFLGGWYFNSRNKNNHDVANSTSEVAKKVENNLVDFSETSITNNEIKYLEYNALIPGTWMLDVDTEKLPMGPADYLQGWANKLKLNLHYNPRDVKFGANISECDIFFRHQSHTERYVSPVEGAEFHNFGKIEFNSVDLERLMPAEYTEDEIPASDLVDLALGRVIGIKTNAGNYAKLRVDCYLPLGGKSYSDIQKYNLKCTIGLFQLPLSEQKDLNKIGKENNEFF